MVRIEEMEYYTNLDKLWIFDVLVYLGIVDVFHESAWFFLLDQYFLDFTFTASRCIDFKRVKEFMLEALACWRSGFGVSF